MVDFCIANSTVPGYVSYRHEDDGSWYIQTLCALINAHGDTDHVIDILQMVCNDVADKKGDKFERMVPMNSNTLRKKCFLPLKN